MTENKPKIFTKFKKSTTWAGALALALAFLVQIVPLQVQAMTTKVTLSVRPTATVGQTATICAEPADLTTAQTLLTTTWEATITINGQTKPNYRVNKNSPCLTIPATEANFFKAGNNVVQAELFLYGVDPYTGSIARPEIDKATGRVEITLAEAFGGNNGTGNIALSTGVISGSGDVGYSANFNFSYIGSGTPTEYRFSCGGGTPANPPPIPANGAKSFTCVYNSDSTSYNVCIEAFDGTTSLAKACLSINPVTGEQTGGSAVDTIGGFLLMIVNTILGIGLSIFQGFYYLLVSLLFIPIVETMLTIRADEISRTVLDGWTIVRNITNLFFILALIVIGLATILRLESYNYKRLLGMLVLMALLVNFSLAIGLAIIRIADLVTINFVGDENVNIVRQIFQKINKIEGYQGINASIAPGISVFVSGVTGAVSQISVLVGLLLVMSMKLLFMVVLGAIAVYLLIRFVALWILLIISPFAYFSFVIPAMRSLGGTWWRTFIRYAFYSPIIAFFLFLINKIDVATIFDSARAADGFTGIIVQNTQYIIIIGFLWGALIVANKLSILGGGMAEKLGMMAVAAPFAGTAALAGLGIRKVGSRAGFNLSPKYWKESWDRKRERSAKKDADRAASIGEKRADAGGWRSLLSLAGTPEDAMETMLNWEETKRRGRNLLKYGPKSLLMNQVVKEKNVELKGKEDYAGTLKTSKEMRALEAEKNDLVNRRTQINSRIDQQGNGLVDATVPEVEKAAVNVLNELKDRLAEIGQKFGEKSLEYTSLATDRDALQTAMVNKFTRQNLSVNSQGSETEKLLYQKVQGIRERYEDMARSKSQELTDSKEVSQAEYERVWQDVQAHREELAAMRPMQRYEARLTSDALVAEESKKLANIEDAQELLVNLNDAIRTKDRPKFKAVAKKLSEDYNDNEIYNFTYYKNENGVYENFESGFEGMKDFINKIAIGKIGMGEREAYEFQNRLSYINESRNHWNTARTIGYRNGMPYQLTNEEHTGAAMAEMAKKSVRTILSGTNRLGFGGESQDYAGKRTFKMDLLGLTFWKALGPAALESRQFGHMTSNAAKKLAEKAVQREMRLHGIDEAVISKIQETASGAEGWNPDSVANEMGKLRKELKAKNLI